MRLTHTALGIAIGRRYRRIVDEVIFGAFSRLWSRSMVTFLEGPRSATWSISESGLRLEVIRVPYQSVN